MDTNADAKPQLNMSDMNMQLKKKRAACMLGEIILRG